MAINVYSLNEVKGDPRYDKNNVNYMVPSVAYMMCMIKQIADKVGIDLSSEEFTLAELPVDSELDEIIPAERIKTDTKRKFISAAVLQSLQDKVTTYELNAAITDVTNQLKLDLQSQFNRILNTTNAVQLLRDIADTVDKSDNLDAIFNTMASKATKEEFEEHVKSQYHVTNNDRKALNYLIKFVADGGSIDWDAEPDGDGFFIKNKPEALPADGGNADTLHGYSPEELMAGKQFKAVFGYDEEKCDIFIDPENKYDYNLIGKSLSSLHPGKYCFREGAYEWKKLEFAKTGIRTLEDGILITGVGNASEFVGAEIYISGDNISFRDLQFRNCIINTSSRNSDISNVTFKDCIIKLDSAKNITINKCNFINSHITESGVVKGLIVTNNRFIKTKQTLHTDAYNLVENNLVTDYQY